MTTDAINKIASTFVVIAILFVLQIIINSKRTYRGRQAIIPAAAFIYCCVGIYLLLRYYSRLAFIIMQFNLFSNGDILLLNIILAAGFVILKLILRPIVASLWKKQKLMEATSINFYDFDEDYSEWFLKQKWVNFRQMCQWLYICIAVISAVFLSITRVYGQDSPLWLYYFPLAILIITGEIWNFLNGFTKEEFQHDVFGDDSDARRVGNYSRIREILEKLFAPQLLAAHTGCEFIGRYGSTELIRKLTESEDAIDRVIADFFSTNDKDVFPDIDYVNGTLQLMHGKSVAFFNPFYRDLGQYITFPAINTLLSGKKCLVITGRNSTSEDVKIWITDILKEYSRMNVIWRVAYLSADPPECEVGMLNFQQLYDLRVLKANREFFKDTDFVFLVEPSLIVNTGQVGLKIVAEEMSRGADKPVYCICDRKTEGLVDTLSHLLGVEITNVQAMPLPRCTYTSMSWNANGDFIRQQLFDKQTKYLGNGIELAAVAIRNQIPKVTWYSETKSPVKDIKWIAGQYYPTICRYMNLPGQQQNINDHISFVSNLWSAPVSPEEFVIAEDEFCNMFSSMRAYLSRGCNQTFINILSENYLLRDYMRCNRQMFTSDPNAIPSIVPDYSKTERNTFLKLILLMAYRPVTESEVIEELSLTGYKTADALEALTKLQAKYTYIQDSVFMVQNTVHIADDFTSYATDTYYITPEMFDKYFADSLKNAYFIVEDEKRNADYIDSKLFGHITQIILPGQFVTYDGKYYTARLVSPTSGVVLRRASDLYDGRKYYRQVRTYRFSSPEENELVSMRIIMDVEIAFIKYSFDVVTTGYLEMRDNHDLRTARLIDFAGDPSVDNYFRNYKNKSVLRIMFPDTTDKLRFTICMLLSEVFRSVFPDAWQYIAVITRRPEGIDGMLNHIVYQVEGELENGYIYIIEDSDIDLGLLEAIDRSITQIMEIIADFLDWHFDKMREPEIKDPVPGEVKLPKDEEVRRSMFLRMADRIRKLFGGKKEKDVRIPDIPKDIPPKESQDGQTVEKTPEEPLTEEYSLDIETTGEESIDQLSVQMDEFDDIESSGYTKEPEQKDKPKEIKMAEEDEFLPPENDVDLVHIDGTDIFDNDGLPEDNEWLEESFIAAGLTPITKTRYQKECYLKFGFEEIDSRIQIDDVRKYLRVRGWSNNALTKARKREPLEKQALDFETVNHCDFCNSPLTGISYEKMNDGRIRCNNCTGSAIVTIEDFKDLFRRVLDMMEGFYNISFKTPITVKFADAQTIARGAGCVFRPSTEYAARVLGYAQRKHGKYNLFIENGSPYLAAIDLTVHELTHIWQFVNWNDNEIQRLYGNESNREIVYEGMSMWSSIQFLYQIGETSYAELQESIAEVREDIYGIGLCLYREKYPFVKDSSLLKFSPFSTFPPL